MPGPALYPGAISLCPEREPVHVSVTADGNVAYNGERSTSPQSPSLFDGDWHMATLTSQPGGGRGYRMYLDGQLAGEVAEGRSYVSPEGFPIPVSLCRRVPRRRMHQSHRYTPVDSVQSHTSHPGQRGDLSICAARCPRLLRAPPHHGCRRRLTAGTPCCWMATWCCVCALMTPAAATTTASWRTWACTTQPWTRHKSGAVRAVWCLLS